MTGAILARQRIIDILGEALDGLDYVRSAWLGGSDASGRTDEWSDIDLQIIVEDERVEDAIEALHAALESHSPIARRYRFPEPTWHGHSQEILGLEHADPHHFLDLVVMSRTSAADRFLERERHGEAMVLFDRDGLLATPPMDWEAHRGKMSERLATMRAQFDLYQTIVSKAVRRGHAADAAYGYVAVTLKPLVELLRMRYCPERFDYGLRYLDRDLPPDWHAEVERLAVPPSLEALGEYHARAGEHFAEQLVALDRGDWSLDSGAAPAGD